VIVTESNYTTFFFHIHREESASRTIWTERGPRPIFALTPGCTCRTDGSVPARTSKQNWQKGMAVADIYPDGYVDKQVIAFRNGRASYSGVTYEGVETVPPGRGLIKHAMLGQTARAGREM
jgi:hypothetical protein